MQNSGELRGTGGSILQFGQMSLDNGAPHLDSPRTVYKIDKQRGSDSGIRRNRQ
jgi:hypothetical protein